MSILSKKYDVPPETIKRMIKDGVISCSWSTYDEVHRLRKEGKSTAEIAFLVHTSQRWVQEILKTTK
jgi:hypothetical protein